jgi:putative oligomerization/nucleic acid binding protein
MLGHNKRLERKLKEHGGIRAWATVLASEKQWASSGGANVSPGQAGSMTIHQKLTLRVEPDGEPPFEATVKQVFNDSYGWHIPQDGYSVKVIYDPTDHSKLVIDTEAMPVAPAVDRDEAMARHESAMANAFPQTRGASPRPDVADELTKLAALRDRGILTDAEFEVQKAKLLGAS